jgi:hypothetical protein
MGKLLRFLAFMAPLIAGAFAGNCLAAKIWPELKEKSPWFWLATGSAGSIGGMLAMRLLFGKRPAAKPTPKTDPVIPEALSIPKPYEEWRKDLDRTVDESAPDFLPLDEWRNKWRGVPRSPKPERSTKCEETVSKEKIEKVMKAMDAGRPAVAPESVPNVVGAPENVIKYVQEEAKNVVLDPFCGATAIRVFLAGTSFHRGTAGPVHFYCDTERLQLDGVEYAVPQAALVVHVPAGHHYVRAIRSVASMNLGASVHPGPRIAP